MVNRVCSGYASMKQLTEHELSVPGIQTSAYALAKTHASAFYTLDEFVDSKRFQRFLNAVESQVGDYIGRVCRMHREMMRDISFLEDEFHFIYFAEIRKMVGGDPKDEAWFAQELGVPVRELPSHRLNDVLEVSIVKCVRDSSFDFCAALYLPVDKEDKRSFHKYIRSYLTVLFDERIGRDAYQSTLVQVCREYVMMRSITDGLDKSTWLSSMKTLSDRDCLYLFLQLYKKYAETLNNHVLLSLWGQKSTKRLRSENLKMAKSTGALKEKIDQLTSEVSARDSTIVTLRKENETLKADIKDNSATLEEIEGLKRELKKKQTECEDLKEECSRLKEQINDLWVDSLAGPDDGIEPTDTLSLSEIMNDPLAKSARIVFVRDVERKNYVMMQRLEEIFPRAKFTDGMSSDINVRTTDLIVALTAYTSHSVYYKGADLAKRQNVPFMPIKNANVEIIASEVLRKLKQISPKVSCE